MAGKDESNRTRRVIDAAAKAVFLAALRRGACREDAAAEAGFSLTGFYGARSRDPDFAAGWAEALAQTPAQERRAEAYAARDRGEVRIAPANRRLLQRRRRRHVRFDARAQEVFLAHLAATCDTRASAAAAGVSHSTVDYHCRRHPAFAEAKAAALQEGYVQLEAEALRQRLAEQERLRAAMEAAEPMVPASLLAEQGAEFDRIMRLLARHDRKPRRAETRFKEGGRRQRMTFDDAIGLLERRLRNLGVRG